MVQVRAANPAKGAAPKEPGARKGEPLVHEPVVDDDVSETEQRHPDADAEEERPRETVELTAKDDQTGSERGVKERERVVPLEEPTARGVVALVNRPEHPMPKAAVEEPRPGLHRREGDRRHRGADEQLVERRIDHGAPR